MTNAQQPVPLLDVPAQNAPLEAALRVAFDRVLASGRFIMGEEIDAFERESAEALEAGYAVAVSSGTDALLMALMAHGIGPGDEVIVPSFTFFATAGCVSRVGATPVFCDVCPVCFNIDPASAAERVTERTKAVIPVHLFGQCADMDAVNALAREHGLVVIEDAAQAMGARYRDKVCGTLGDGGIISFFPSKNLGGFGDGGLVVTDDGELAAKLRRLRNHGMEPKYYHPEVGGNFRMDALQAALLRVKLPHLDTYSRGRAANAADYMARLSELDGVVQADPAHCRCLDKADAAEAASPSSLVLPVAYPHNTHIWNQFTLRVPGQERRDALRDHLIEQGIGCEIYYPVPLHRQACFASLPGHALGSFPVSERLAGEVLSIPVYPELTADQREAVVRAIGFFLMGGKV